MTTASEYDDGICKSPRVITCRPTKVAFRCNWGEAEWEEEGRPGGEHGFDVRDYAQVPRYGGDWGRVRQPRRAIRCALTISEAMWVVGEAVDVDDLVVELETRQPCVLVVSDVLLKERTAVAQLHFQLFGSVVRTLVLTESPSAELPCLPVCDLWGCLSYFARRAGFAQGCPRGRQWRDVVQPASTRRNASSASRDCHGARRNA